MRKHRRFFFVPNFSRRAWSNRIMGTLYEDDVIAWSEQQAALLRSGRWDLLDIDNIAEEIEDVGKSEKRELQSRHAVLVRPLRRFAGASGAMVAAVGTSLRTVAPPDRPAAQTHTQAIAAPA